MMFSSCSENNINEDLDQFNVDINEVFKLIDDITNKYKELEECRNIEQIHKERNIKKNHDFFKKSDSKLNSQHVQIDVSDETDSATSFDLDNLDMFYSTQKDTKRKEKKNTNQNLCNKGKKHVGKHGSKNSKKARAQNEMDQSEKYRDCISELLKGNQWFNEQEENEECITENEPATAKELIEESGDQDIDLTANTESSESKKQTSLEIINISQTEMNKVKCEQELHQILNKLKEKRKHLTEKYKKECKTNESIKQKWKQWKENEVEYEKQLEYYSKKLNDKQDIGEKLCKSINNIMKQLKSIQTEYRISPEVYHLKLMKLHPKERKNKQIEHSMLILKSLQMNLEKTNDNIQKLERNIIQQNEKIKQIKYALNPVKDCE